VSERSTENLRQQKYSPAGPGDPAFPEPACAPSLLVEGLTLVELVCRGFFVTSSTALGFLSSAFGLSTVAERGFTSPPNFLSDGFDFGESAYVERMFDSRGMK